MTNLFPIFVIIILQGTYIKQHTYLSHIFYHNGKVVNQLYFIYSTSILKIYDIYTQEVKYFRISYDKKGTLIIYDYNETPIKNAFLTYESVVLEIYNETDIIINTYIIFHTKSDYKKCSFCLENISCPQHLRKNLITEVRCNTDDSVSREFIPHDSLLNPASNKSILLKNVKSNNYIIKKTHMNFLKEFFRKHNIHDRSILDKVIDYLKNIQQSYDYDVTEILYGLVDE